MPFEYTCNVVQFVSISATHLKSPVVLPMRQVDGTNFIEMNKDRRIERLLCGEGRAHQGESDPRRLKNTDIIETVKKLRNAAFAEVISGKTATPSNRRCNKNMWPIRMSTIGKVHDVVMPACGSQPEIKFKVILDKEAAQPMVECSPAVLAHLATLIDEQLREGRENIKKDTESNSTGIPGITHAVKRKRAAVRAMIKMDTKKYKNKYIEYDADDNESYVSAIGLARKWVERGGDDENEERPCASDDDATVET